MNHYPHTTVATVVPQQGRFLMVQEKSGESLVYNQPAGHVEVGEGLIDAAVRETFEETGWQVRVDCLIGINVMYIKKMEFITYGTVFLPRLKSRLLRRHQTRTLFRRFGSAMMTSKPCLISFVVHLSCRRWTIMSPEKLIHWS